jgi:hypothetical protein
VSALSDGPLEEKRVFRASKRLALVITLAWVWALVATGVASADTTVVAKLHPLNGSGAGGTVRLTATDDGRLIVVIHAHGLVPNQPHAQHIHGSREGGGHFMCPSLKDDKNGDGILTNEEAMGEYGTIFFSLTTHGDSSAKSALALNRMPVADSTGHLDYRRTFSAKRVPDALLRHLSSLHVVQHGIDVNHNGRYDMHSLGVSTFARNLGIPHVPEEATDPATCGVVTGAGASTAPRGGVDTGGGPTGSRSAPVTAAGLLLLAGSVCLVLMRRRLGRGDVDK